MNTQQLGVNARCSQPRVTKGVKLSQPGVADPKLERKAAKLKWFFTSNDDKRPFTLVLNDCNWPGLTLLEKLNLQKGKVLTFKTSNYGTFEGTFVAMVKGKYEKQTSKLVADKRRNNQDQPLHDMSNLP